MSKSFKDFIVVTGGMLGAFALGRLSGKLSAMIDYIRRSDEDKQKDRCKFKFGCGSITLENTKDPDEWYNLSVSAPEK